MAKFAVGESVVLLDSPTNITDYIMGDKLEILACPGYKKCPCCGRLAGNSKFYSVRKIGFECAACPEHKLGKLPPDDHADDKDTTEDPGLTRLKKLLKHETESHKKPITTPETET